MDDKTVCMMYDAALDMRIFSSHRYFAAFDEPEGRLYLGHLQGPYSLQHLFRPYENRIELVSAERRVGVFDASSMSHMFFDYVDRHARWPRGLEKVVSTVFNETFVRVFFQKDVPETRFLDHLHHFDAAYERLQNG